MSDKVFKWDDSALIPDFREIKFPGAIIPGGEDVTIKMIELPKPVLVKFVNDAVDAKFVNEETGEKTPFDKVEEQQWEMLTKYLAAMTRGTHDQEWFKALSITSTGIIALVEMMVEINHLPAIVHTGGNWLMLPTVIAVLEGANSDNPAQTMQA